MNKLLITICLLFLFVFPLVAEDKEMPKYKIPEVIMIYDKEGNPSGFCCIDGLLYIINISQFGASFYQMRINDKDGKEIFKKCECEIKKDIDRGI